MQKEERRYEVEDDGEKHAAVSRSKFHSKSNASSNSNRKSTWKCRTKTKRNSMNNDKTKAVQVWLGAFV